MSNHKLALMFSGSLLLSTLSPFALAVDMGMGADAAKAAASGGVGKEAATDMVKEKVKETAKEKATDAAKEKLHGMAPGGSHTAPE